MIRIIKNFFESIFSSCLSNIDSKLDNIIAYINQEEDSDSSINKLMRHCLGSIDLSDVKAEEFSDENGKKEYLSKISSIVLPIVKNRAKAMIALQKDFISLEANGMEQIWFAKGSINGLSLLLESFERDDGEFKEITKPAEKFDKQRTIDSVVVD